MAAEAARIKELEEQLAANELAAKSREETDAAELARLSALVKEAQSKGALAVEIPGKFEVVLEDPKGEKVKQTLKFADGVKTIVAKFGVNAARVNTAALMKLANGEELSADEKAESPLLMTATKDQAAEMLTNWAKMGANVFKVVTLIIGLLFVFSTDAAAQKKTIGDGRFGWYPTDPTEVDTLAADSSVTWEFPNEIQDLDNYEYHFQPYVDVLADTATIVFLIQEAIDPKNTHYTTTATVTISNMLAAATAYKTITSGDVVGSKFRIVATATGAGSTTQIRWVVRIRKKVVTTVVTGG